MCGTYLLSLLFECLVFGFNGGNCSCPRQAQIAIIKSSIPRVGQRLKVNLPPKSWPWSTVQLLLLLLLYFLGILFTFSAGRDGHIIYLAAMSLGTSCVCVCMCVCEGKSFCPAFLAVSACEISWLREIYARSLTNVRIMRKWKALRMRCSCRTSAPPAPAALLLCLPQEHINKTHNIDFNWSRGL